MCAALHKKYGQSPLDGADENAKAVAATGKKYRHAAAKYTFGSLKDGGTPLVVVIDGAIGAGKSESLSPLLWTLGQPLGQPLPFVLLSTLSTKEYHPLRCCPLRRLNLPLYAGFATATLIELVRQGLVDRTGAPSPPVMRASDM